jgi:FtsP/CotA-like multicopper oxidase with cupredoxin domain
LVKISFVLAAAVGAARPAWSQHGAPAQSHNNGQKAGQISGRAYLEQLKTAPNERRNGFKTFEEDLKRIDRQPARLEAIRATKAVARAGLNEPLANPEEVHATDGVLEYPLVVDYGSNTIYNLKLGTVVQVKLRSYNGGLFGKTLRLKPGEQLTVKIDNRLPPNPPHDGDINIPHDFNTTNLHTHGLHVSPAGNSDNVLITTPPGSTFQNEIHLPRDHAPGTFWYHSHVHGSTAIQVTSGMVGALFVDGGLDDLEPVKNAEQKVMIFQQIPYVESSPGSGVYQVEDYSQFGPAAWDAGVNTNGWRTTINGQTQPFVVMRPGEVQRWRMIHAGLRETIDVAIVPYDQLLQSIQNETTRLAGTIVPAAPEAVAQDVSRESVRARKQTLLAQSPKLNEIAADGLAYGFVWPRDSIDLQPGYRSDVLVKIDTPGIYVIVDNEAAANDALWGRYESPKVLGFIYVGGDPNPMPLPTNAELAPLRPHSSITDAEVSDPPAQPGGPPVKRFQKVELNIDTDFNPPRFEVDSQPYNPSAAPRTLMVGKAYEWLLTSRRVNHPFHIHVNPFEIVTWNDADGNSRLPVIDGQQKTIWKDTILTRQKNSTDAPAVERLVVRARNEVYIGRFVLHCHILDHEDQGMMQDVEIVAPGSAHH